MADISKISPDGGTTEYNIKDTTARTGVSTIEGKIPSGASSSNKMATASDVADCMTWEANAKTGVHNFCESKLINVTERGITFSRNSNDSYTISGTNDGTNNSNARIDQQPYLAAGTGNLKDYDGNYTLSILDENGNAVSGVEAFVMQDSTFDVKLRTSNGVATGAINATNCFICITIPKDKSFSSPVTVFVTLCYAEDKYDGFTPFAMTNKELTDLVNKYFIEVSGDNTTFNIPFKREKSYVMTFGEICISGGLYHFLIKGSGDNNEVVITKIVDSNNSRSLSGSFADDVLTITSTVTIYGGMWLETNNIVK